VADEEPAKLTFPPDVRDIVPAVMLPLAWNSPADPADTISPCDKLRLFNSDALPVVLIVNCPNELAFCWKKTPPVPADTLTDDPDGTLPNMVTLPLLPEAIEMLLAEVILPISVALPAEVSPTVQADILPEDGTNNPAPEETVALPGVEIALPRSTLPLALTVTAGPEMVPPIWTMDPVEVIEVVAAPELTVPAVWKVPAEPDDKVVAFVPVKLPIK
jgi:hypothetical protein